MTTTESTATRFGWHFLSLWSSCETAWWNANLRHHPKDEDGQSGVEPRYTGPALMVGGAIHKGLEVWYLSGWDQASQKDTGHRDIDATISAAVEHIHAVWGRFRSSDSAEKAEAEVRGLLQGYHQHWSEDYLRVAPGPDGEPLVEQEFQLDLGGGHLFTARLDTVVYHPQEDPEGLWILEHKTVDVSRYRGLVEALQVDGQITGQVLQAKAHWEERVRGALGNFLIKRARSISPFQREEYPRPQVQLEKFHLDARRRLARIEESTSYYRLLLDGGMSQDEAARVAFDASHAGTQKCLGCEFLNLCKNRAQSEWTLEAEFLPKQPR